MTKDLQDLMKERFDVLIDDVMTAGLFLEQAVEVLERGMIERALRATKTNQSEAAKLLGIHRNTLQRKMVDHNIDGKRPRRKPVSSAKPKTVRRRKAS
jgi:DNA-binding NtrC family response regulator